MKPLLVLLIVFIVSLLIRLLVKNSWTVLFSGNLAMCVMLCFTALGHVLYTRGMELMIPPAIPFKTALVYLTGVMEVAMGIALLFPSLRSFTGYVLVLFLVLLLPANIYAALKSVNIEKASYDGPGIRYLWFRVPEQLFFMGWVYYFSL